jgi:hypothetical protein
MKTEELTGAALDWAVAKCEGKSHIVKELYKYFYSPSTDWKIGGPIMEREGIDCTFHPGATIHWTAMHVDCDHIDFRAPTLLEAVMRMYVYIKLGDEVEIPEDLI